MEQQISNGILTPPHLLDPPLSSDNDVDLPMVPPKATYNAPSLPPVQEPFVKVDNYICPILHNQIKLKKNVFLNLLDYGNGNIETFQLMKIRFATLY